MKNLHLLTVVMAAGLLLARASEVTAKPLTLAGTATPHAVTPLDTFSFDIVAYNNSGSGTAAYAVAPHDVTFGATTVLTGANIDGQNVTISSSEVIGATTTTDTFTVSVPTSFAPSGYTFSGGTAIKGLEFDIDQDSTYADPVNVTPSITSFTNSGSYSSSGGTTTITPTTTLLNSGSAYQMYEYVYKSSGSITTLGVNSFTYSITYSNVPEPATVFGGLTCAALLGWHLRRRKVRQVAQA